MTCAIQLLENMKKLSKLNTVSLEKRQYPPNFESNKGFLGTFVNQALPSLHVGSLEITLTVPLNINCKI